MEELSPLEVYVDDQLEMVQVFQQDDLSTVACLLEEKGHTALNVAFPHIRVNGVRVSEKDRINSEFKYHFCK